MDIPKGFIVTPAVAALRDFLTRSGARHAFLIGAPGVGKTATLHYLASSLRAENYLVVMVRLREIDTGDQLIVEIARALLDQTQTQAKPLEFDPLDQIRAQFADQFTTSQRLSRAAEVLERIIQLVMERIGLKTRAYIFLDGLDEAQRAGDIIVVVESLAEHLRSTSLVVTSRESSVVDRLGSRTAFDTFTLAPLTTITSASQDPASFVQQMTADDSVTSSADGFKAVWLLYSAALAARDVDVPANSYDQTTKAFVTDSRTILRRIGWAAAIKGESRASRWMAVVRSVLPEKVSLKFGPITIEPNLNRRGRGWLGGDIKIDEFINRTDQLLQATNRRLLIVFDQIDEAFKYQRDRQEALVQGLFLAESFLSLRQAIRLVVLLRTDLFELYDIQEKNKFVSRTVRLDWSRDELRKQLLQRLFSNAGLRAIIESLNAAALQSSVLAQIQFRIVFPTEVEGKPFEEWLFESLKNGKNHVAPRQIILFLNLAKDNAKDDAIRRRIPMFSEKEVADAMTRLSELSYQEVISDFRAATAFVRNCRAGKIMEFELEEVKALFDENEGSAVLQLERLERLGFVARTIAKEGDSLVSRFRIPRLFTRCWQTSN